ncbi:MAG: thioredoxin family protein [Chitinispirillaceae bacterium]|nr:thioredoxin family protein [Chitinispirillaceae bacterium]
MQSIFVLFAFCILLGSSTGSTIVTQETVPVASATSPTGTFKLITVNRDSSVTETGTDFSTVVSNDTVPVLIHFSAEWAAPCKTMHPVLVETAKKFSKRAFVGTVDIEESPEVGAYYMIRSVPTFVVLVKGREVARSVGMMTQKKLAGLVEIKR